MTTRRGASDRIKHDSRGSTALFFAAVILPILIFAFALAGDVGHYFREMQLHQEHLDDSALWAAKSLPYPDLAKKAAVMSASSLRWKFDSLDVGVGTKFVPSPRRYDFVEIYAERRLPLNFPRMFGLNVELPLKIYSSSRPIPVDALILFDVSSYMSPEGADIAVSDANVNYPAAQVFSLSSPARAVEYTLKCFHPKLLLAKIAALRLADYLSAGNSDALGLGFFPAGPMGVELVKDVSLSPLDQSSIEAKLSALSGSPVSDVDCLRAAREERWFERYNIPEIDPLLFDGRAPFAFAEDGVGPESSPRRVSARYSIWSRPTRSRELPQISNLISFITTDLVSTRARPERGGLASSARLDAFVFMGDFPYQNGKRFPDEGVSGVISSGILKALGEAFSRGRPLALNFFIGRAYSQSESDFEAAASELDSLFNGLLVQSGLNERRYSLRTFYFRNLDDYLESDALAKALSGRMFVVSR